MARTKQTARRPAGSGMKRATFPSATPPETATSDASASSDDVFKSVVVADQCLSYVKSVFTHVFGLANESIPILARLFDLCVEFHDSSISYEDKLQAYAMIEMVTVQLYFTQKIPSTFEQSHAKRVFVDFVVIILKEKYTDAHLDVPETLNSLYIMGLRERERVEKSLGIDFSLADLQSLTPNFDYSPVVQKAHIYANFYKQPNTLFACLESYADPKGFKIGARPTAARGAKKCVELIRDMEETLEEVELVDASLLPPTPTPQINLTEKSGDKQTIPISSSPGESVAKTATADSNTSPSETHMCETENSGDDNRSLWSAENSLEVQFIEDSSTMKNHPSNVEQNHSPANKRQQNRSTDTLRNVADLITPEPKISPMPEKTDNYSTVEKQIDAEEAHASSSKELVPYIPTPISHVDSTIGEPSAKRRKLDNLNPSSGALALPIDCPLTPRDKVLQELKILRQKYFVPTTRDCLKLVLDDTKKILAIVSRFKVLFQSLKDMRTPESAHIILIEADWEEVQVAFSRLHSYLMYLNYTCDQIQVTLISQNKKVLDQLSLHFTAHGWFDFFRNTSGAILDRARSIIDTVNTSLSQSTPMDLDFTAFPAAKVSTFFPDVVKGLTAELNGVRKKHRGMIPIEVIDDFAENFFTIIKQKLFS